MRRIRAERQYNMANPARVGGKGETLWWISDFGLMAWTAARATTAASSADLDATLSAAQRRFPQHMDDRPFLQWEGEPTYEAWTVLSYILAARYPDIRSRSDGAGAELSQPGAAGADVRHAAESCPAVASSWASAPAGKKTNIAPMTILIPRRAYPRPAAGRHANHPQEDVGRAGASSAIEGAHYTITRRLVRAQAPAQDPHPRRRRWLHHDEARRQIRRYLESARFAVGSLTSSG